MKKLYEISPEIEKLMDVDDESLDVEEELRNFETEFSFKVSNIVKLMKNLDSERIAVLVKLVRLQVKAKALRNRIEQLERYLKNEMIQTGLKSVRVDIFRIQLHKSPRSLVIRDIDSIPSEFKKAIHEWKIDRRGILKHFKETGEIVPGVEIKQEERVQISE